MDIQHLKKLIDKRDAVQSELLMIRKRKCDLELEEMSLVRAIISLCRDGIKSAKASIGGDV